MLNGGCSGRVYEFPQFDISLSENERRPFIEHPYAFINTHSGEDQRYSYTRIRDNIIHEVGHILGLRHGFESSHKVDIDHKIESDSDDDFPHLSIQEAAQYKYGEAFLYARGFCAESDNILVKSHVTVMFYPEVCDSVFSKFLPYYSSDSSGTNCGETSRACGNSAHTSEAALKLTLPMLANFYWDKR